VVTAFFHPSQDTQKTKYPCGRGGAMKKTTGTAHRNNSFTTCSRPRRESYLVRKFPTLRSVPKGIVKMLENSVTTQDGYALPDCSVLCLECAPEIQQTTAMSATGISNIRNADPSVPNYLACVIKIKSSQNKFSRIIVRESWLRGKQH